MRRHKATDSFYYGRPWRTVRAAALRRDGRRCVVCGADVSAPGAARVDHILPRRDWPELELELGNIRTLCAACDNQAHREKGLRAAAGRVERFRPAGCDVEGMPADPRHPWWR